MLAVKYYPKDYVEGVKTKVKNQVKAFEKSGASAAFEPVFFNNMVLVLETAFVHRTRAMEGKDGNPLNEVRMMATSLLEGNGALQAEKSIKWNAGKSVLGYEIGDEIQISKKDFQKLSNAFFDELESKFV